MYLCCMWRYFYIYILIFRNNVARKVKPAMFSCKIITIVIKYNPHVLYKDVKLGNRTTGKPQKSCKQGSNRIRFCFGKIPQASV